MQRFDLRDRLGLNGYGALVRVVEDVQLSAVRRADPARLRAVVPKGQFALARRDGIALRGVGVVGDRKAEPLRLDAAVAPESGADRVEQPALCRHFFKVPFHAGVVVEGIQVQFPSLSLHGVSPPPKSL